MDNQLNTGPATSQPPPKAKKKVWLWVLPGFVCLCLCVVIPLMVAARTPTLLNLFNTGVARVKISAGKYDGKTYTADGGIFSCDYSLIMSSHFSPLLQDTASTQPDGSTRGDAWATDDFGTRYEIAYVQLVNETTVNADELITVYNAAFVNKSPGVKVLDQKPISDNKILTITYVPHGSNLTISKQAPNSPNIQKTIADLIRADYFFVSGQRVYIASYGKTPLIIGTPAPTTWSPDDTKNMQAKLDEFFAGCSFK
jgi:hypothetical protein